VRLLGQNGPVSTFPLSPSARVRDVIRHEGARRRHLVVLERTGLTDTLVRFTFGGDLEGFASLGPEDHVKAFFAGREGIVARDYTPAEFRPIGASSGPELDLDVVVHGDAGPATAWASRAGRGDELEIAGPRGSRLAPTGFTNALLLADPAGMPALRRWIRAFAGVLPVHAVLFGGDGRLVDHLDDAETLSATPQLALTADFDLLDVVRSQDVTADTFVWAAGEAGALIPVRRWLKQEAGLPKANLSLHGYWKSGVAGLDHHAPLDPADPD
jgi:NADPH-dependent ferric siderophore reductase